MVDAVTVKVTTKKCLVCDERTDVLLTSKEARAVAKGDLIQHALPNRDANFRELLVSGTHPDCWDKALQHVHDRNLTERSV